MLTYIKPSVSRKYEFRGIFCIYDLEKALIKNVARICEGRRLLQENNAPYHYTSNFISDFSVANDIAFLQFLDCSPYLSQIENIWD